MVGKTEFRRDSKKTKFIKTYKDQKNVLSHDRQQDTRHIVEGILLNLSFIKNLLSFHFTLKKSIQCAILLNSTIYDNNLITLYQISFILQNYVIKIQYMTVV